MRTVNQKRPNWDYLTQQQQEEYVRQATYLKNKGYSDLDLYTLAETIYIKSYESKKNNKEG